ncbi:MAG: 3-keto-5-aminohexanoate cleavage protein [Nitrospirae bacterium]|nr:3-keto-5-aminohexanoate cleavage protein [Nitrospirota bacterium]
MDKLVINFTPTGMVPTKAMTSLVPISVDEIVEDVLGCAELGASIVHIHARDREERPTPEPEIFAEILQGIRRERQDLILCVTTSGRTHPRLEDRAAVLDLSGECKPDMASLTLGSMNFARTASVNSPEIIQALAQRMLDRGIRPELEVFEGGMINYGKYLMKKGLIQSPGYFNLLLGNIATAQADEPTLDLMLATLPEGATWALAGIGDCQLQVHRWAMARGGHVRVGLEDNIYFDEKRTTMASNRMQVQRIVDLADELGREISTPDETRSRLDLER